MEKELVARIKLFRRKRTGEEYETVVLKADEFDISDIEGLQKCIFYIVDKFSEGIK